MATHYLLWLCYFLLLGVSASNNCSIASAQVLADPPLSIPRFMKRYGKYKIEHLWIGRQPVQKWVQGFLDLITHKTFTQLKELYKYDDMYHLYITFRLSNDKYYKIEKNEQLTIHECGGDLGESQTNCDSGKSEYIKDLDFIPSEKKKSFNVVMKGCEITYDCFYYYTANQFNCQNFVHRFIHQLGINDKDLEKYDTFIRQNGFLDAFQQHGLAALTTALTDAAALGSVAVANLKHAKQEAEKQRINEEGSRLRRYNYNKRKTGPSNSPVRRSAFRSYRGIDDDYDAYYEDEYNDDEEEQYLPMLLLLITALTFISADVGNVYIKT